MAGTIMIVEDEPAVARGVQVALEREGYEVTVQPTGEDALSSFADAAADAAADACGVASANDGA